MSSRELVSAHLLNAAAREGPAASERTSVDLPRVPAWKRRLDVWAGLAALVLLAPVMLVAGCLVALTSPGPVLFRQTRIGLGGRPFEMLKFRTMRHSEGRDDNADREAFLRELRGAAAVEDSTGLYRPGADPRITRVGVILRRLSIDELPQLINVLRGDMSLVGPRPALPWQVDMLTPHQCRRHECLPGITGLWQVRGRNRLGWEEMFALDIEYVERCSLRFDLAILLGTPKAVLVQRYTR